MAQQKNTAGMSSNNTLDPRIEGILESLVSTRGIPHFFTSGGWQECQFQQLHPPHHQGWLGGFLLPPFKKSRPPWHCSGSPNYAAAERRAAVSEAHLRLLFGTNGHTAGRTTGRSAGRIGCGFVLFAPLLRHLLQLFLGAVNHAAHLGSTLGCGNPL